MTLPLALCGLDCSACPIRLATVESDPAKKTALREEVCSVCRSLVGIEYAIGDITDCDGCRGTDTGRLFSGCRRCEIRKCAMEKELTSCAFCGDYPCGRLEETFRSDPAARDRLDALAGTFAAKRDADDANR
jgi:hypothetical protein